jgi:XapX domain-containing protein
LPWRLVLQEYSNATKRINIDDIDQRNPSMFMLIVGIALALIIGAVSRWFDLPSPSPSGMAGAVLVFSMTAGYLFANHFLTWVGK